MAPRPPRPHTRSDAIHVTVWLLLSVTTLALALRYFTKVVILKRAGWRMDDSYLMIAYCFYLAQAVLYLIPLSDGWGLPINTLSTQSLSHAEVVFYAGNLLYVTSLAFAKTSLLTTLLMLRPFPWHLRAINVMYGCVVVWWLTSFVPLAAECLDDTPWSYLGGGRCLNRTSLLLYVDIVNVLIDVVLIVLPGLVMSQLRIKLGKKLNIIALFGARIAVVVATVTKLAYISGLSGSDVTYDSFAYLLCSQLVIALSIVATSVHVFQPLILQLQSGMLSFEGGSLVSLTSGVHKTPVDGSVRPWNGDVTTANSGPEGQALL